MWQNKEKTISFRASASDVEKIRKLAAIENKPVSTYVLHKAIQPNSNFRSTDESERKELELMRLVEDKFEELAKRQEQEFNRMLADIRKLVSLDLG